MDENRDAKVFGWRLRRIVAEHRQMIQAQEAAVLRAERIERARRQFLLFLFFAILAAWVIYRDEVDVATSTLYARAWGKLPDDPRRVAQAEARNRIRAIASETKDRQAVLDEITPGLGSSAFEEGGVAATNGESATPNKLQGTRKESRRRQAALEEIEAGTTPGRGTGGGSLPVSP